MGELYLFSTYTTYKYKSKSLKNSETYEGEDN